jgi:chromosomal replication initiation ATPase DnaA
MMRQPSQLPLVLPHAPSLAREDFIKAPSNSAALRLVEAWPDWPAPVVLLSGPPGSGKTHLVHIWAAEADAAILAADSLMTALPAVHRGAAFAVDALDAGAIPETPLFHLINAVREAEGSLLLAGRAAADDWPIALPDLRSRLRLAAPVALGPPEDALLRQVLVKLFADRQLLIEKPVIDYLVARMERSLSAAGRLVEALDRAGLSAGRRITRAMAAEVLGQVAEDRREFADRQ